MSTTLQSPAASIKASFGYTAYAINWKGAVVAAWNVMCIPITPVLSAVMIK